MSSAARRAGWTLVAAGALLAADGAATIAWQEPLGALRQARAQTGLEDGLADRERRFAVLAGARTALAPVPAQDGAARLPLSPMPQLARTPDGDAVQRLFAAGLRDGDPAGRLVIPALDVDEVVVEGTRPGDLARGPGRYRSTALPGEGGTVGIAGHRTTYGAPLRHADRLRPGDRLELRMPYGRFAYEVTGTRIVAPSDTSVLRGRRGRERLVLTTCHPLHSSSQRLVVLARRAT